MSDLTTADGFELIEATHRHKPLGEDAEYIDVTDSISIDRWSKHGKDRLYLNGLNTGDGWISLQTDESGGDKWTKVEARRDRDGDELTIRVGRGIDLRKGRAAYTLVIRVEDDAFGDPDGDDQDDEGETELVADGGEDTESPITDADIEAAIQSHDDPDHPEALSVADIRGLLAQIQQQTERIWGRWMDAIERNDVQVAADTGGALVLAVRDAPYGELLEESADPLSVAYDEIARDVVSATVHNAAERLTDRSWAHDYALVVAKPKIADAGETYVTALINGLLRRGLSPGQAWAYYGVEIRGHSRNAWASRCGYSDHSAVSEPLRKAERKLDA